MSVGLNVSMDACLSLCVGPGNWVQPRLHPQIVQIVGPASLQPSGQDRMIEDGWMEVYFSSDWSEWEKHSCSHRQTCFVTVNFGLSTGRQDPNQMDSSRGHCLQEVHLSQRCVELWYCHVGSDLIRRATLLGDVQPGCESHTTNVFIPQVLVHHSTYDGLLSTTLFLFAHRWSKQ